MVEGKGEVYEWLKKALNRKGYRVLDQQPDLQDSRQIKVLNSGNTFFELEVNGKISKLNKISDVLDVLEQDSINPSSGLQPLEC